MKFLEIEGLSKRYGTQLSVEHFEIAVERGEFISFLGPSGCGKTTTLRMVAGFEEPSSGQIRIDGRDMVGLRPNQRNIGMVFQSYALFPNMTVAQNVGFGLKIAKRPQSEIQARVAEMLDMIKLPQLAGRYPYQLSGGQQQRVALARALAGRPKLLLLDEPLSALDAKIRVSLRADIRELQRSLGITTIYVTHDQEEALAMSDRIVVMSEGRIEQLGTPFEIYNRPKSRFVASFVGTLNILEAEIADADRGLVKVDGQEIRLASPISRAANGGNCVITLRPEAVSLLPGEAQSNGVQAGGAKMNGVQGSGPNRLNVTIEEVSFLGAIVRIKARLKDKLISLDTFNNAGSLPPERGASAQIAFAPADVQTLV